MQSEQISVDKVPNVQAEQLCSRDQLLPPFSYDKRTRTLCIIGLSLTCIVSVVLIIVSIPTFVREHGFANSYTCVARTNTAKEVASLALNVLVTICTEVLGFIHATSLRWALYHEGRLRFNSNLRLFTSARQCAANSWYINCIWAFLITVSYSTASQVLLSKGVGLGPEYLCGRYPYMMNSQALAILGISLALQSFLALWCLSPSNSRKILSWNSSPLNTTLALRHRGYLPRTSHAPTAPRRRQSSAAKVARSIGLIVFFLWLVTCVVIGWGVSMWYFSPPMDGKLNRQFNPSNSSDGVHPPLGNFPEWDTLISLAMVTAIQIVYTLALHTAEQTVNFSRDESVWRRASNLSAGSHGARVSLNSVKLALSSWKTITLLVFKPISHWLFGLSATIFSFGDITFKPLPIFCLAGIFALLATLVTYLGYGKPKGPQPATWGDVTKLSDLIDDWGAGAGGELYWGDKGTQDSHRTRTAGTSPSKQMLGEVQMNGLRYWGLGKAEME